MSNETTEARHRRHAESFHRLSVRTADPKLRQLLTAIADLHGRIAESLATLNEHEDS